MITTENIKRELAFIFFSRRNLILTAASLVMAAAVGVALFWPSTYGATTSVLIKGKKIEKNLEALEDAQLRATSITKEDLQSEVVILTSAEVIRGALERYAATGPAAAARVEKLGSTPNRRVVKVQKALTATVVPSSNVIDILFAGKDPAMTLELLQVILGEYFLFRDRLYNPVGVGTFLASQVERFQKELEEKHEAQRRLVAETGAVLVDKQIENNLVLEKDLTTRLHQLDGEATQLRLMVTRVEGMLAQSGVQYFSFIENPGIQALAEKLRAVMVEFENANRRYLPESEPVRQLDEQVKRTYATLHGEVEQYLAEQQGMLEARERMMGDLRAHVGRLHQENVRLRQSQLTMDSLERDTALIKSSYETLFRRSAESDLQGSAVNTGSYVSILAPPTLMESPIFPKPMLLIPFGIVAGVMLGLSLGFVQEFLDHTFKRPEDVQRVSGLPLLFSIPHASAMETAFFQVSEEQALQQGHAAAVRKSGSWGDRQRAGGTLAWIRARMGEMPLRWRLLGGGAVLLLILLPLVMERVLEPEEESLPPAVATPAPGKTVAGDPGQPVVRRQGPAASPTASPVVTRGQGSAAAGEGAGPSPARESSPAAAVVPSATGAPPPVPVVEEAAPDAPTAVGPTPAGVTPTAAPGAPPALSPETGGEATEPPSATEPPPAAGAIPAAGGTTTLPAALRPYLREAFVRHDPASGNYFLQLRSTRERQQVEELAEAARGAALPARIVPATVRGERYFRLLVGEYPSNAEARKALEGLHRLVR